MCILTPNQDSKVSTPGVIILLVFCLLIVAGLIASDVVHAVHMTN